MRPVRLALRLLAIFASLSSPVASAAEYSVLGHWLVSGRERYETPDGPTEVQSFKRYAMLGEGAAPIADIGFVRAPKSKDERGGTFDPAQYLAAGLGNAMRLEPWKHRREGDLEIYEAEWKEASRYVKVFMKDEPEALRFSVAVFRTSYFEEAYLESELIQHRLVSADGGEKWLRDLYAWLDVPDARADCGAPCDSTVRFACEISRAECRYKDAKSSAEAFTTKSEAVSVLRKLAEDSVSPDKKQMAQEILSHAEAGYGVVKQAVGLVATIASANVLGVLKGAIDLFSGVRSLFGGKSPEDYDKIMTAYREMSDQLAQHARKSQNVDAAIDGLLSHFRRLREFKRRETPAPAELAQLKQKIAEARQGAQGGTANCQQLSKQEQAVQALLGQADSINKIALQVDSASDRPDVATCEQLRDTLWNLISAENRMQKVRIDAVMLANEARTAMAQTASQCHKEADAAKSLDTQLQNIQSLRQIRDEHERRVKEMGKPRTKYLESCVGTVCSESPYPRCVRFCGSLWPESAALRAQCLTKDCAEANAPKKCREFDCDVLFERTEDGKAYLEQFAEENASFQKDMENDTKFHKELSGYLRRVRCSSDLESMARQVFYQSLLETARKQTSTNLAGVTARLRTQGNELYQLCKDNPGFTEEQFKF